MTRWRYCEVVSPSRLDEMALDEGFLCRLDERAADLNDYN